MTSQIPEPLSRLSAWLFRRTIAKPAWLQHQYQWRLDSGQSLAIVAFLLRFLLPGDGFRLPGDDSYRRSLGSLTEDPRAVRRNRAVLFNASGRADKACEACTNPHPKRL